MLFCHLPAYILEPGSALSPYPLSPYPHSRVSPFSGWTTGCASPCAQTMKASCLGRLGSSGCRGGARTLASQREQTRASWGLQWVVHQARGLQVFLAGLQGSNSGSSQLSLEGRNMWINKTAPKDCTKSRRNARMAFHCRVCCRLAVRPAL